MDESCIDLQKFSYEKLVCATNNFSEKDKLGEGATGSVFKGFLKELNCFVAVKRVVVGSKYGIESYLPEVKILTKLQHKNLVNLIGWCGKIKKELLIVYELVENKTLEYHLFNEIGFLDLGLRKRIALDLASALLYLHEECEQSVLHCDIKLDNVLLETNFNAKLCDFGLARPAERGQESGYPTVLSGAPGYLAPECEKSRKATKESDIYSFGVVLLQMACGRRAVERIQENGMKFEIKLVDWVWEKLRVSGENISAVADPRLRLSCDEKDMERLIVVGLACANPNPNNRPCIREVINMLKC
ncbi:unnamed protein product [Dovyalis caffra]|uniref:Protein kinase domain-containing protein n=1 Tax=Dovyalis caffra TaxID=77055 RepID=A0AAV1RU29_9ROSI|nr:unnamed protein product [Dovyalis caffra]